MTITSLKNGYKVSNDSLNILINPVQKEILGNENFVISVNELPGEIKNFIGVAGEYERGDALVTALKLNGGNNSIDYILIAWERQHILFLGSSLDKLSKEALENLPQIDFLLIDPEIDEKSLNVRIELIHEIEPVFVILNSKSLLIDKFSKALEQEGETTKKLKVKYTETENLEEIETKYIILSD